MDPSQIYILGSTSLIGRHIYDQLIDKAVKAPKFVSYPEFWRREPKDILGRESTIIWTFGGRNHVRANLPPEEDAIKRLFNFTLNNERIMRVVYLSTGEVYGNSKKPFNIVDKPNPASNYGHNKLSIEKFLQEVSVDSSTYVDVCRLANVYGPNTLASQTNLIARLLQAGKDKNKKVRLTVNLDSRKQYGNATDYAREICASTLLFGPTNSKFRIWNIAPRFSYSVREVIDCVSELTQIEHGHLVSNLHQAKDLPYDDRFIIPNSDGESNWSRIDQAILNL